MGNRHVPCTQSPYAVIHLQFPAKIIECFARNLLQKCLAVAKLDHGCRSRCRKCYLLLTKNKSYRRDCNLFKYRRFLTGQPWSFSTNREHFIDEKTGVSVAVYTASFPSSSLPNGWAAGAGWWVSCSPAGRSFIRRPTKSSWQNYRAFLIFVRVVRMRI